MAYVLEDEDEKSAPAGGPLVTQSMAPAQQQATPSGPPQKTSTDFVSWDRVLNANRDASKAYANKLAGNLKQGAQGVESNLGAQQQQHEAAVRAGTPSHLQPARPPPGAAAGPPSIVSQPTGTEKPTANKQQATNPFGQVNAQLAQTAAPTVTPAAPGQVPAAGGNKDWEAQALARSQQKYTGPGAMSEGSGWAGLLRQGQEATRNIGMTSQRDAQGNLRGNAGIQALLDRQPGAPDAAGQSRMDAALVGSTGRKRFDELQRQYGGLLGKLDSADKASKALSYDAMDRTERDAGAAKESYDSMVQTRQAQEAADKAKAADAKKVDAARYKQMKEREAYLRERTQHADQELQKVLAEGGFLGLEGWKGERNQGLYQEAKRTGDWSKFADMVNKEYGNNLGDYLVQVLGADRDELHKILEELNSAGMGDGPTYKGDWFTDNIMGPFLGYLMTEQEKRNAGGWSPDVMLG